jgi:hypothetical protein
VEVVGHVLILVLETLAVYGMLADRSHRRTYRYAIALPLLAAMWFGWAGVLTAAVGCSIGTQLFLGARLLASWQRRSR